MNVGRDSNMSNNLESHLIEENSPMKPAELLQIEAEISLRYLNKLSSIGYGLLKRHYIVGLKKSSQIERGANLIYQRRLNKRNN